MTRAEFGPGVTVEPGATVGYEYADDVGPAVLLGEAMVRSGSIVYADVELGSGVRTGHDVLVREHSIVDENVLLGSKTVLDGHILVGSNVSIQTGAYLPPGTEVGDDVFLGPGATLTNDRDPVRTDAPLDVDAKGLHFQRYQTLEPKSKSRVFG